VATAVPIALRRVGVAIAATALAVVAGTACDTDDGRQLREPTDEQRASMPTTTSTSVPSTAGAPIPGEFGSLGTIPAESPPPSVLAGSDSPLAAFTLQAPWAEGGPIDARFTCDGEDRTPTLTWTAPPAGTVELALVVTDDDAEGFIHYAVAEIPPAAGEVGEGGEITGAAVGLNGFGATGWGGPCPPSGETHTYRWTMYALAQQSELPNGFTGLELQQLGIDAGFASAEVTGTYARAG